MKRKTLTALAVAGILLVSATPSVADRPDDKNCPGAPTWSFYVSEVLNFFGINPGTYITDECDVGNG